jgi:hydrogenase maturation protease
VDLVIGVGNPLRRDDGIGPRVAEALAELSSVSTCTVQELVPELAARLEGARRVLFIDAEIGGTDVRLARLEAGPAGLGHGLDPNGLLTACQEAYGAAPEAWTLCVPGVDFGYGEGLSDRAASFVPVAIDEAARWLGRM